MVWITACRSAASLLSAGFTFIASTIGITPEREAEAKETVRDIRIRIYHKYLSNPQPSLARCPFKHSHTRATRRARAAVRTAEVGAVALESQTLQQHAGEVGALSLQSHVQRRVRCDTRESHCVRNGARNAADDVSHIEQRVSPGNQPAT